MNSKPKIMGVLNVTPDSFYDGGRYNKPLPLKSRIKKLLKEGADIIDIGGESTRPNAKGISIKTELARILPAVKQIRLLSKNIPISIDTSKPQVAFKCLECGANMINDITGLKNPAMMHVAKKYNCPVIIMHMRGTPKTMQSMTDYKDILKEIYLFFDRKIRDCLRAGISRRNIIIDPGIGFSKTAKQNLFLIKNLNYFKKLKVKILIGTSRKSFIGVVLNQKNPKDRLLGSLSSAVFCYLKGADILRVHDVKQTAQVIKMAHSIETVKL